jgi:heme A synthase
VAAGAFVAGAVAVFVTLPAVAVVVYDDVPVQVVDELIGIVVMGEAQTKLGWATGAPAPRVIVQAIEYGAGNITGALPVLVNL